MTHSPWESIFLDLFGSVLERYSSGRFHWDRDYAEADLRFLASIGYQPREFFDFVEDYAGEGEPAPATSLLIAAVRRDYFHTVQRGIASTAQIRPADLPPKSSELEGIPWLPRIIRKAEAKLRGELHPEIMYGCGGDRAFLREHDLHPADFLRIVWAARGNPHRVLDWIKQTSPA